MCEKDVWMCQSLSCVWLCDPMDCSLPGFSVHGILQARILDWIAIPFSMWRRNWQNRSFYLKKKKKLCTSTLGLLRWLSGKESTCQCRRCGFDPYVRKIPWNKKYQPTPEFLPGKSNGQRSLVGCSWCSHKELNMTEWLRAHAHTHTHTHTHSSTLPQVYFLGLC